MNATAARPWVWSGVDARGVKVQGESHAPTLRLVRAQLRQQGIVPRRIRRLREPWTARWPRAGSGKEIAVITRQLATMLEAGIPLLDALGMIAGAQRHRRVTQAITAIAEDIGHGAPLHEALRRAPALFDPLYRHLVQVGESTGTLDTVFARLASERERREQLRGRIVKALLYPAVVMVMALVVCVVMLVYVVPQFEQTFRGMGAELPAFTRAIVALSRWLGTWGWALLLALVLTVIGVMRGVRHSPRWRTRSDRLLLRLPLIGGLLRKAAVARFARALATTVQAGVPLVDALQVIAGATGNRVFATASGQMAAAIRVGGSLHEALRSSGLFPALAVQMVAIGEEAGALDHMLHKLAGFHEEEVANAVDALSSLLEPAIMLVIGVLVGGLVIGMYLPVFNLGAAL